MPENEKHPPDAVMPDGVMTSFERTFAKARADGWSLFLWRGATYHTRRADIARRP
jgi:hypothetical protein